MKTSNTNDTICLPVSAFRAATPIAAAQELLKGFAAEKIGPTIGMIALQSAGAGEDTPYAYALTAEGKAQPLLLSACPADAAPMAEAQRLLLRVLHSHCGDQAVWDCNAGLLRGESGETSCAQYALCLPLPISPEAQGAILLARDRPWYRGALRKMDAWAEAAGLLLADMQRRQLFADLERSKQHWETTFDSLQDLLYIQDTAGQLLKVNRALAQRIGISARELMARPDLLQENFAGAYTAGNAETFVWTAANLSATFDVTRTPACDKQGRIIGWITILRDITERLQMEGRMRQQEKLAALGQMVAGIAHELNNPLTSIIGYSERLLFAASGNPATVEDYTRKIAVQAERAGHIAHDLLNFARTQTQDKIAVSLNQVVLETVDLYADKLQEGGIALRLCLAEDLPEIGGNPAALQQVLINLLSNARDAIQSSNHADRSGTITLTTALLPEGGVGLWVEDNGPGILPEHLDRLLEPFFTTKRVGEGTGLGLSICFGILRAHDATLHAESPPDKGACFRIQFPPAAQATVQVPLRFDPLKENCNRENANETGPQQTLNIAVLDDEPIIRELLQDNLRDQGHCVMCFGTPQEVLEALKQKRFDVILSDIKMPEMTGLEFYARVAEACPLQARRILFLSGDLMAAQTRDFIERTGCLTLTKPFRQVSLLAKINEVMQRNEAEDGSWAIQNALAQAA